MVSVKEFAVERAKQIFGAGFADERAKQIFRVHARGRGRDGAFQCLPGAIAGHNPLFISSPVSFTHAQSLVLPLSTTSALTTRSSRCPEECPAPLGFEFWS